jgi:hypothetical protein
MQMFLRDENSALLITACGMGIGHGLQEEAPLFRRGGHGSVFLLKTLRDSMKNFSGVYKKALIRPHQDMERIIRIHTQLASERCRDIHPALSISSIEKFSTKTQHWRISISLTKIRIIHDDPFPDVNHAEHVVPKGISSLKNAIDISSFFKGFFYSK